VALVFGLTDATTAAGVGRGGIAALSLAAGFAALGAVVSGFRWRQARLA
jgi:hypothetical protein